MEWKVIEDVFRNNAPERASVLKYKAIKQENKSSKNDKSKIEVAYYQAYLQVIQSFHESLKSSSWRMLENIEEPLEPENSRYHEKLIQSEIELFQPSLFEKLFKKDNEKLKVMKDRIPYEMDKDDAVYFKALDSYTNKKKDFDDFKTCLKGIVNKEPKSYLYWLEQLNPFSELQEYGIVSTFVYEEGTLSVLMHHNNNNIIPMNEKKIVSQEVVAKKMSNHFRLTVRKNVIFSATVRAAREIFEAIPIKRVVVKSYVPEMTEAVLAVAFKRELFARLNVIQEDPIVTIQMFNNVSRMDQI